MFGSWSWIVQVKVFWVKLLNRHQDGIDSNGRGFLHSVFLESAYWHYIFLDNVMFRCTNSCKQACPGEIALNYLRNIPLYQLLLHIWPIFVLHSRENLYGFVRRWLDCGQKVLLHKNSKDYAVASFQASLWLRLCMLINIHLFSFPFRWINRKLQTWI